jgi:hypothetical protein
VMGRQMQSERATSPRTPVLRSPTLLGSKPVLQSVKEQSGVISMEMWRPETPTSESWCES